MSVIAGVGLNLTSVAPGDLDGAGRLMTRWAELGCSHVEIVARRQDVVLGGRLNMAVVRPLARLIERSGMTPVLHAPHAINLMDRARLDMHLAVAEAAIEFCRITGCPSMVLHSGHAPLADWVADSAAFLAEERAALRRLGDLAGAFGLNLALENLIASPAATGRAAYGCDPRALAAQLARTDHPHVGACLDFGHGWLSAHTLGFDYIAALEALSPHVWHLHLHDNCGRPQGGTAISEPGDEAAFGQGDMHAPMFWGTIPWAELLPRLRLRSGTIATVELNGRYNDHAEGVVAAAKSIAAHLDGAPLINPWETTQRQPQPRAAAQI
ncbi:MAG: sugar phosphate isomerase/epimerase family protein [Pseudomonadota bacterium]